MATIKLFLGNRTASSAITGTIDAQESGSDTVVLNGGPVVSGTLTAQESGSDTAAFNGGPVVSGSVTGQESGADTAVFAGSGVVAGSLSGQESGSDTVEFNGAVEVLPITGTLECVESGSDTASFNGSSGTVEVPATAGASPGQRASKYRPLAPVYQPEPIRLATITGTLGAREVGGDTVGLQGAPVVTGTLHAQEQGADTAYAIGRVRASRATIARAVARLLFDQAA